MRITILYQYFGTPKGYWSTRIYEFARRWVNAGHEVTVITSPYDKSDIKSDGYISYKEIEGIKLVIINSGDSNRFSTFKRIYKAVSYAVVSSYFVTRLKSDVVLASSGPITVGIPGLIAKWLLNINLVFEVRDLWPLGAIEMGIVRNEFVKKLAFRFEELIYKNSVNIVTASQGQANNIIERFPNLRNKVNVIYNSSDIELFSTKMSEIDKNNYFLYAGSLGFIHNVKYLLDSAKFLKDISPNVNILIIGDGKERFELEEIKQQYKLSNVEFLGQLPKEETVKYIQNSIATIFTTLDNFVQDTSSPNKIFDSFAAGKPIIQTTRGWISELINKYNCGLNCDPQSPLTMALNMVFYFENPDILIEHSNNAKYLAENVFNRDLLSEKYLELVLESIIK